MTLHVYDCAYNNAWDRGLLLDFIVEYDEYKPRILVPAPYHNEVRGLQLMLGLTANLHYVNWYHGMNCLEGWYVVIDPEKDIFTMQSRMVKLEPRRI